MTPGAKHIGFFILPDQFSVNGKQKVQKNFKNPDKKIFGLVGGGGVLKFFFKVYDFVPTAGRGFLRR